MGSSGASPRPCHERQSVLSETGPFGPLPNWFEGGAFIAHRDGREKGKPPFWFVVPFHGHWLNPQGFNDLQIGEGTPEHPQTVNRRCHTTRGKGDGQGVVAEGRPRVRQQHAWRARAAAVFSSLQRARV
ncbi:hypothetical protein ES319_1Z079800v1 [Gossypium barbadense]|uniref:Uncharacterized protein n=3 Tax=Gossypium TaxID=3633 RepID=A0A5J5N7T7_GOSBA|nr:hypothetical protein ES319_1Z079800v1 [Gossypium barbadense]TYH19047.1 hypothetical protein ES288_A05G321400v1 [Gossypium darwinii]TYI29549.1 hypothetical protein ES332_A05G323600v1 [Gossypium tomentosum]